ncbi:MAG: replication initiation protein [Peptostreptococcaceae bacterium]
MEEIVEKDRIVMKHNSIVKARYNISTIENRIFLLLLYKLQRQDILRVEGELYCDIHIDEFRSIIKKKSEQSAEAIGDSLINLRKQSIYFKDNSGWGEGGFLSSFKYLEKEKTFRVWASIEIHKYIKEYLEFGYTPNNFAVFITLVNPNAQRFYDLLRLWSNTKSVINYTVDEIRELLMLEDKYLRYPDFKRRIITPAIEELKKKGKMDINIKEHKDGKKVTSIDFIVKDLDKRVYFDTKSNNVKDRCEISNSKAEYIKPIESEVEVITEIKDFYVPNKKLFTTKTLSDFINDFNFYDFKEAKNKKALQESILAALEKDDEEKIKVKVYNYFKVTLDDKLKKIMNMDNDIKKVKTRYHNINQSFDKYSPEELEKLLMDSQREKGMIPGHKTKFHNFEESFTKYSEDEFNEIIEKSQKEKFGK